MQTKISKYLFLSIFIIVSFTIINYKIFADKPENSCKIIRPEKCTDKNKEEKSKEKKADEPKPTENENHKVKGK